MRAEFRLDEPPMARRPEELLVIGAGVVGMATALTLAERGRSWLEVERVDPNAPEDAADLGDGRSRTTRWGQCMPPGEVS